MTVADDLPSTVKRQELFTSRHVCLCDPRHARLGKRLTERVYFEHQHVIVSYNGDLRAKIVSSALTAMRSARA